MGWGLTAYRLLWRHLEHFPVCQFADRTNVGILGTCIYVCYHRDLGEVYRIRKA